MDALIEKHSSELLDDIIKFYVIIENELDTCHPEAFDVIYDLVQLDLEEEDIKNRLSDFSFDYIDELEGCFEEGFTFLQNLVKKYNIK